MVIKDYIAFSEEVNRLTGHDITKCFILGMDFYSVYKDMFLIECPDGGWFIAAIRAEQSKSIGMYLSKSGIYKMSTDLLSVTINGTAWLSCSIQYGNTRSVLVADKSLGGEVFIYTKRSAIKLVQSPRNIFRLSRLERFFCSLKNKLRIS